jgi:tetratricopeptide (TPR) repeat protein
MSDSSCPRCGLVLTEEGDSCRGCGTRISDEQRKSLWMSKGELLGRMGRHAEAAESYAAAIRIDPQDISAYERRAASLEKAEMLEDAIACLRRVAELGPSNVTARISLGGLLFRTGKKEEALAVFREALAQDAHSVPALRGLASGLFNMGRYGEAADLFEKLAAVAPPEAARDFLAHARDSLLGADKKAEALRICRRIQELSPGDAGNLKKMGAILTDKGELNEALLCLEEALRIEPGDANAWVMRGDAECMAGRPQNAVAFYDEAINIDGQLARAWANKGIALDTLNRPEEAARCLEKGVELEPLDDEIRMAYCEVLIKLGHFTETLGILQELVSRSPNMALAWMRIGDAQQALSHHELALEAYDRATSIDEAEANLKKAVAYYNMEKYPEAMSAVDRSLESEVRSDYAWYLKGAIHYGLGQFEEAQECAEKALAINPDNSSATRLKEACAGRTKAAEQSFKINDIFIVLKDGRLLAHVSRTPGQTLDEVMVSGMFTAVKLFIQESFKYASGEELGRMEMGGIKILIDQWRTIFSAVVISGNEPFTLRKDIRRMLVHIYDRYHPVLEGWNGDMEKVAGMAEAAGDLLK